MPSFLRGNAAIVVASMVIGLERGEGGCLFDGAFGENSDVNRRGRGYGRNDKVNLWVDR